MAWRRHLPVCVLVLSCLGLLRPAAGLCEEARFVGSKVCAGCHQEQYAAFQKHSKKAQSTKNVRLMAKGLTQEELTGCFACHTTGYGQPGGFTSFETTPDLADAGCEVCHGPGSVHAASGDPTAIKGKLTLADCQGCHNAARVKAFGYKPLLRAGAH